MQPMTVPERLVYVLRKYHTGESAAAKGENLASSFGVKPKQIQRVIHNLRYEGVPICGDHDGYFFASCAGDIEHTARFLITMGWQIQKTACAMLIQADLDHNAPAALAIMKEAIVTL